MGYEADIFTWSKMALDILVLKKPMSKAIGLQPGVKRF